MKCSDKTSISWSLEVEDDMLDALRFFFEKGVVSDDFVKKYLNMDDGEDMRFRVVYKGPVWEIEDGFDKESPLHNIAFSEKNNAIMLRDWLNENIKELPFKEKVKKIIPQLWDHDEIIVDENIDEIVITEIESTGITSASIKDKLDCKVKVYQITGGKSVFKITEV